MTVGYSGTPLPRKLGIGPGHRALLVAPPAGFTLDVPGVTVHRRANETWSGLRFVLRLRHR